MDCRDLTFSQVQGSALKLILDEKITTKFIFAAILIISGVFIMNLKKEMFKKSEARSLKSED